MTKEKKITNIGKTSLIVLGTVQDGGSPHIACNKECCKDLFLQPDQNRLIVSIGIIDHENKKKYIFEATPNLIFQLKNLYIQSRFDNGELPDGIFITHAHVGHYSGLMYLGKEAMNSDNVNVYVMPKMKQFLENNGPWDQLVDIKNIHIKLLINNLNYNLTSNIKIMPFIVPHRNEYSETIGYIIEGTSKKILFIPDIDKWDKDIIDLIYGIDYAFIDGTFYDVNEIDNRNISEIPHPFIVDSMNLFKEMPVKEKNKIYFIHLNHTNPVLNPNSKQTNKVTKNGFNIARINQIFEL